MLKSAAMFTDMIFCEYMNLNTDAIEKFCLEIKNQNQGVVVSNIGGWQSQEILEHQIKNNKEISKLCTEVNKKFKEVFTQLNYNDEKYNVEISNFWININRKEHSNSSHNHGNSLFSAIYYVKTPNNCGNLVFKRNIDPICRLEYPDFYKKMNSCNGKSWSVQPEENKLVIFPSWIYHYVQTSNSEYQRISMAFNSLVTTNV